MSLLKAFKSHNQIINIGQKTKQQSHSQNKMNASVLDKNLKWNIFSQIKVIDYKIILTFMQTVYVTCTNVYVGHTENTHICF